MFEGITEFAGFYVTNRAVTRFLLLRRCTELAHFIANTVAHVHRQAGQVRSSTACVFRSFHSERGRSAVRVQPWVL